ncbi:MAG: STAS domain-containing protein [Clostridia bacterium]|nr:STAS domain-containing protein [Clostridia bacterium]
MNISTEKSDGKVTVILEGWLDTLSAPALGEALDAVESAEELTLDFTAVEYMSSAGLRQVVAGHRKAKELGAAFSVIGVGDEVMSIFKLTGIDKKLTVKAK